MNKDTRELLNSLKECEEFGKYYNENCDDFIKSSLVEYLAFLIESKGLEKSEVIRKSQISEVYGYQIFSGIRRAKREKLICLALAMDLSLEETQMLLKVGQYPPLYVKQPWDCVIIFGICNGLSVVQINALLFEYGLNSLD